MKRINFSKGERIASNFTKEENPDFYEVIGFHQNVIDKERKIYYGVDISELNSEEKEMYFKTMETIINNSTNQPMINITSVVDQEDGMFHRQGVICTMPYNKTIRLYHQTNNIFYEEVISEIKDIIDCYFYCVELNLPICVSETNISLANVKNPLSPYPRIVVTPYAFITALFPSEENKNDNFSVHYQFAKIFEYFHAKIEGICGEGNYFLDIIDKLNNNEDVRGEFAKQQFFNELPAILNVPSFDLNDFERVKSCGSGKFGAVSVMKRKSDEKLFAMKEAPFESLDYLQKEAFTLKSMNHRNVVKFEGFTIANEYINIPRNVAPRVPHGFMLMEFCKNGNLGDLIQKYTSKNQYLNINLVKTMFGQICEACLYVHYQKRYVHRDLKLANIVISAFQPFIQLKLCDFGFARSIDTDMLTQIATPLTCDIRILEAKPYDDRSDLFSIGCILYCLINGSYPCGDCRDIPQLLKKVKTNQINLEVPKGRDKKFEEALTFVGQLMNLDGSNITWDEFRSSSFVMECIDYVDGLRSQYNI